MEALIHQLPKVELHLHIEGTLEPELMFTLAQRNGITLPYPSVEALRAAYQFEDLQSFLDLYYQGAQVLIHEQDFYDLTIAYLEKCAEQNVVHTEIFFDPQTHTARGIAFATVMSGICRALEEAEQRLCISSRLIMCFLRHLSEAQAIETWQMAQPYLDDIDGVGLDSSEQGNPPEKFARVFALAKAAGLPRVAHAGEEGPAAYIETALDQLDVCRIDHGVRCSESPALVERLRQARMPLTVCPLSNLKLRVVDTLAEHNLAGLLEAGLVVTINADDPAYFGGYIEENYLACWQALGLSAEQIIQLALNSVEACWLPEAAKKRLRTQIAHAASQYQATLKNA